MLLSGFCNLNKETYVCFLLLHTTKAACAFCKKKFYFYSIFGINKIKILNYKYFTTLINNYWKFFTLNNYYYNFEDGLTRIFVLSQKNNQTCLKIL